MSSLKSESIKNLTFYAAGIVMSSTLDVLLSQRCLDMWGLF